MSNISINKLTNANVYVNSNDFLGRAEEVTLPSVKMKMVEHKALGLIGTTEYPAGIDKLECKITWSSLYTEVLTIAANPYKPVKLEIKASLENYTHEGRDREEKVHMIVDGYFKDFPMGSFKQSENVSYETNMTVTAAKMVVGKVTVFNLDVVNNIFEVKDEKLLANYKANLGI